MKDRGMKMGKLGRNGPCPCGSGKKFKNCCKETLTVKEQTIPIADPLNAALEQGINLQHAGQWVEAETLYKEILAQHPRHADALHLLGTLFFQRGNSEAAATLVSKAIEANPHAAIYYNSLGVINKSRGRAAEAVENYQAAIKFNTSYCEAHNNLGNLLHDLGRLDEAIENLKKSIAIRPEFNAALKNLGNALMAKERWPDALVYYQRAMEINPQCPETRCMVGTAFLSLGKLEKAKDSYRQALTLNPDYPEAHNNLGAIYAREEQHEAAASCYKWALQLRPSFAPAHYNLGNVFQEQGALDEAAACYQRALACKPDYFEAHNNLGNYFLENGHKEAAEASFRKTLEINPVYAEAHSNIGYMLFKKEQLQEADACLRKALAINPHLKMALNNLGIVSLALGCADQSHVYFDQALQQMPGLPEAFSGKVAAYLAADRADDALSFVGRAIKDLPGATVGLICDDEKPVTAMMPFGRSGSLFFHALFDGHPQISTLPGIYFKGWFGLGGWDKLNPANRGSDWKEKLVDQITREFEPIFDARSTRNVIGKPIKTTRHLARASGFFEMGPNRDTPFYVDKEAFSVALLSLLAPLESITQKECFLLIHQAFDSAVGREAGTQQIFYHIHNPDVFEMSNFLRQFPQARLLYIIRQPVQSLESWMMTDIDERPVAATAAEEKCQLNNHYIDVWLGAVEKVESMLFDLQSPFHEVVESRAVRLEDVKRAPHQTMPQIAAWMGIDDDPALYDASFCGLQYWGPTSKVTGNVSGFDTKAIDRKIGSLFGERDQKIFETLFWPFSHLHGYTQMTEAEFRARLTEIRPWLDDPLQFEKRLYAQLSEPRDALKTLAPYLKLHRLLERYWSMLERNGTYPFMVKPLLLAG